VCVAHTGEDTGACTDCNRVPIDSHRKKGESLAGGFTIGVEAMGLVADPPLTPVGTPGA